MLLRAFIVCLNLGLASLTPSAFGREVDFEADVLPILARRCALCHTEERSEGDLNISTRSDLLKGGATGPAAVSGDSRQSLLIQLVAGADQERLMPAKGPRLSDRQIETLRIWIDQGMPWKEGVVLTPMMGVASLDLHKPRLHAEGNDSAENAIDVLLQPYFATAGIEPGELVSDRVYARRVYLDLIGLLPSPEQLAAFEQDPRPKKRGELVRQLLDDRCNYALHWMTFWNDALRNSYRGTGFIDRNRTQITAWLFASLYDNLAYDEFVRQLTDPREESSGFVRGIVWRGVVNASQRRELQAAQSISQVFLGINLKCASCHDSFVDPWKLSDAYALAAVFAEEPLEVHECDRPNGETAVPSFLFPKLGKIDATATPAERRRELAAMITAPSNGRFSRTIVNRLWERFFGRGIIASLDNLDEEPFDAKLLDWLAADFVEHGYDLKHTMQLICTSRAYQLKSISQKVEQKLAPFRGPTTRRMSAEQFEDAISQITGVWQAETKEMGKADSRGQGGQLKAIRKVLTKRNASGGTELLLRAAIVDADPLQTALGRPNREQVVTRRDSISTPLEALEFTNGLTLDHLLRECAKRLTSRGQTTRQIIDETYAKALGRTANDEEVRVAAQLIGSPARVEAVQDFLWTVAMLPEFQFIE
jgi:hypothetical protein